MELLFSQNEIMSLARKWIELKIIMLREMTRQRKRNLFCSLSYVESTLGECGGVGGDDMNVK
jgi:hypothetical protein